MNYCRQLTQHFDANGYKNKKEGLCALLARSAVKFILPSGGIVIDDKQLRGIDESLPLNLPFPRIALEYIQYGTEASQTTRHILFAQQMDDHGMIYLDDVMKISHGPWWVHDVEFSIPTTGYMDRTAEGYMGYPVLKLHDRECGWLPDDSNYGCQRVLFAFLNALSCSNVHIEDIKPKNTGKTIKPSLPFDSYHFLTIDPPKQPPGTRGSGSHRSPREHQCLKITAFKRIKPIRPER